jgi:hypothetical protein
MGDVVFIAARGGVAVHRYRAQHIVNALGPRVRQPIALAVTTSSSAPVRATAAAATARHQVQTHATTARISNCGRHLLGGWASRRGPAVYVAALAVWGCPAVV